MNLKRPKRWRDISYSWLGSLQNDLQVHLSLNKFWGFWFLYNIITSDEWIIKFIWKY